MQLFKATLCAFLLVASSASFHHEKEPPVAPLVSPDEIVTPASGIVIEYAPPMPAVNGDRDDENGRAGF